MSEQLTIIMAQINPIVGDVKGNTALIIESAKQAKMEHQADIVVFPEMTLTGYPPEDLLFRETLYQQVESALSTLCEQVTDVVLVIGYPMKDELGDRFNMAAWIEAGQIQASYIKQNLPNYSVFDEKRYFSSGQQPCVVDYKGVKFGLLICEDIWKLTPADQSVKAGADILLNLNASPFSQEKHQDRIDVVKRRVEEVKRPVIYVNQVGGQDELMFDGGSFATCAEGEVQVQGPEFKTDLIPVKILKQADAVVVLPGEKAELFHNEARVYEALVMGVHDYVRKNSFKGVLLGLSGGIDSALTLAIAVDALGAEQVEAVMMPFKYTADISVEDAEKEAQTLGVHYHAIPIEPIYDSFESALSSRFEGYEEDVTEENMQARIRGVLLMSISNKVGKLVLATSNKSEVAVGYSTLYGDMVGGFSPLKDVPKTLVYRLSEYRNTLSKVIPERVITRAPSAELRPDQKDQDSLPDYDVLDTIIKAFVKEDKSPAQIVEEFEYDKQEVERVTKMISRNEYKRRQAAPGVKISPRAFGRDRRYPITSRYAEEG
ncbi:NAD+ synthase [Hydrogenovibrio sp. 3SP14C1]|uniref:NAD+ synthase n=1 Tax=Hydrogenovibrio sp. 3SP14C1 TaxID=3038774 RepID=UPI0024165CBB|nr:NAD+ synthase [Hydrogenovibrio sp. 3SP14C1]MDG4813006.1 NAD+ synthase [Hydrogenovibrio sp. 3SP14C1]